MTDKLGEREGIETSPLYQMDGWAYIELRKGKVQVDAFSDGRMVLPSEVHYLDLEDLFTLLLFVLKWGERLWT